MRIALVHMRHARVGGTELILNRVARHLAERGHEVTIVCRSHEESPHSDVRFEVLRSFAPSSAWRMWAFARDVERHVRATRYDLVFGLGKTWTHDVIRTGGGSHRTYVEKAGRFSGRPWERWLGVGALKDRLAVEIERRAYAPGRYRRVIANSRMVKRDIMHRYGVPEEQIDVVYNGVDLERFHPRNREGGEALRAELGLGREDLVLCFVGKGFGRKGLARLLDALPEVVRAHPDARLLVVGRDSSQPAFERRAAQLGVADAVRFTGERTDVELCYGAADLFVLPTHYDSFAFSVLEALATGLPVITTERAGAAELVEEGVCGEVLEGEVGAHELARALNAWCDRERLRFAAGEARAAAERCSMDASLESTERILLEVAGGA